MPKSIMHRLLEDLSGTSVHNPRATQTYDSKILSETSCHPLGMLCENREDALHTLSDAYMSVQRRCTLPEGLKDGLAISPSSS